MLLARRSKLEMEQNGRGGEGARQALVIVTKSLPCHHMHCKAFMIKLTMMGINSTKFTFSRLNVFL
jgi:hypothetical protein